MRIATTKILLLIPAALILLAGCSSNEQAVNPPDASDAKAVVYFFWGDGCPHCVTEKAFLERMKQKYSDLEVRDYETWKNPENAALLQRMADAYGVKVQGVPTTFIGDDAPFVGFAPSMEADMENRIKDCIENGCVDPGVKL
jgi:thiol-disulfide isomerase/thioredoxin